MPAVSWFAGACNANRHLALMVRFVAAPFTRLYHSLQLEGHHRAVKFKPAPDSRTGHSLMQTEGDVLPQLKDAHCHPQLDQQHVQAVGGLQVQKCTAMGVCEEDWGRVGSVVTLFPNKVIPAFGVHPWWSHLHATKAGQTLEEVLEAKSEQDKNAAIHKLETERTSKLSVTWELNLHESLLRHPNAIVGEIGLDRAAHLPGTKARTCFQHQLCLFERQLDLAALANKPVSVHCVRAYGHLLSVFMSRKPEQCPPRIMMHSYGGSVDDIKKLLKLKHVGNRFYFSFSSVINGNQREKLFQRIKAVPDDRLLIESDEVSVLKIDNAMMDICSIAAEAKQWSMDHAAKITAANFDAFYTA